MPTTYRGNTCTYKRATLLASLGSHTFDYDANGLRTKKNDTDYIYIGGKLIFEKNSDREIDYIYGNDGITGIKYNGTVYLFRKNVFGDVTHIYDTNGVLHAHYIYDAWGNHTVVNDTETEIGTINPIRYRSYYYDTETKLYYLRARYYDPETGRFISQDNISYLDPQHLTGLNLYAYCNDNPVMYIDENGCVPKWLKGLAIGLAVVGVVLLAAAVTVLTAGVGTTVLAGTMAGAVIHGAAVGTLIGAGVGAVAGGVIGGATTDWSIEGIVTGVMVGFGGGATIGAIAGGTTGGIAYLKATSVANTPLRTALQELERSGLRPGQTQISQSRVLEIYNKFDSTKAYSSVYSNGSARFIVDGHHTTVASYMRGTKTTFNMNIPTSQLPSATNIHWIKKWYEFWKTAIKIIP